MHSVWRATTAAATDGPFKFITKCIFGYNLMRVSTHPLSVASVQKRQPHPIAFDDDNDEKKVVLSVIAVLMGPSVS